MFCVLFLLLKIPAVGKNFSSSNHVDYDVGFTFGASFNGGGGDYSGNSFLFPDYNSKIVLDDMQQVQLFMFNSGIKVFLRYILI